MKILKSAFFLLLSPVLVGAQEQPVSVQYSLAETRVEITQPTDLRTALEEVCRQTASACEGTQHAQGNVVAPLILLGTWSEIIAQLLDGSGLNYIASRPSETTHGHLVVQSKGAGGVNVQTVTGAESPSSRGVLTESIPAPTLASVQTMSVGRSDVARESSSSDSHGVPGDVYVPDPSSISGSPLTSTAIPSPNGATESVSYFPFPDSHGNPIPVTNAPERYLPFPDSQGNPIPVDPNAPGGSPFPPEAIPQAKGVNH